MYGSTAGVATFVGYLVNEDTGDFDATTAPTLTAVQGFLQQQSAKLDAWLAGAGYALPIVNASAVSVLDNYANLGAAGLCELTQRMAGHSATDENNRENVFLAEFRQAKAFIESGALVQLGAVLRDSNPISVSSGTALLRAGRDWQPR